MELAEQLVELAKVFTDITTDITDGTELEVQVKIQQLKKFEVFNTLRLSMEVLAEVAIELITELVAELVRTELVQTELAQTELVRTELV